MSDKYLKCYLYPIDGLCLKGNDSEPLIIRLGGDASLVNMAQIIEFVNSAGFASDKDGRQRQLKGLAYRIAGVHSGESPDVHVVCDSYINIIRDISKNGSTHESALITPWTRAHRVEAAMRLGSIQNAGPWHTWGFSRTDKEFTTMNSAIDLQTGFMENNFRSPQQRAIQLAQPPDCLNEEELCNRIAKSVAPQAVLLLLDPIRVNVSEMQAMMFEMAMAFSMACRSSSAGPVFVEMHSVLETKLKKYNREEASQMWARVRYLVQDSRVNKSATNKLYGLRCDYAHRGGYPEIEDTCMMIEVVAKVIEKLAERCVIYSSLDELWYELDQHVPQS
jgi:hypothetical protein